MILNGTINYLQLREHKKFQKLVNVPFPTPSDDDNNSSDNPVDEEKKATGPDTASAAGVGVPGTAVTATTSASPSVVRIFARSD